MSEPTCGTCRYWDEMCEAAQPEGGFPVTGRCRRYPPMGHSFSAVADGEDWPIVAAHDYCGEHRPLSDVPEPSPGLRWLWEHGKRPQPDPQDERARWYSHETREDPDRDDTNELPIVILNELPQWDGGSAMFPSADTAMLAAARAIESSQWLAMEEHGREQA